MPEIFDRYPLEPAPVPAQSGVAVGGNASTQTEVNAGTNGTNFVTPATLAAADTVAHPADVAAEAAARTQALAWKAPLDSPALTGTPTVPTAAPGTNSTQAASTAFVAALFSTLTNGAPGTLDTFLEAYNRFLGDESAASALTAIVAAKLAKAANLSDLADPVAARTALGLGTAATRNVGTDAGSVAAGNVTFALNDVATNVAKLALPANTPAGYVARITNEANRIEQFLGDTISEDANWLVLKNTVLLTIVNWQYDTITINGIPAVAYASTVIGWIDPANFTYGDNDNYFGVTSISYGANNTSIPNAGTGTYVYAPSPGLIGLPYSFPPRVSATLVYQ